MNKLVLTVLTLAAVLAASFTMAQSPSSLTRYRNKNRLLLIFAPGKSDPRWREQDHLLEGSASAFNDRDLLRFDYLGAGAGAELRKHYGVAPKQFRVLLIGKDGHVAFGGPTPIQMDKLTGQIDRMPMRREEMRQRGR